MTDPRQRYDVRSSPRNASLATPGTFGPAPPQVQATSPQESSLPHPLLALRDEAPKQDAGTMHHGGSFGAYMQLKNSKLREQFESNSFQAAPHSNIFQGVAIHVNGYTQPSAQELKQIMLLHGGRYEHYLYREHVTHLICNNLPDTKLKQLAHAKQPLPIVRPEWIMASLQAGRLLPVRPGLTWDAGQLGCWAYDCWAAELLGCWLLAAVHPAGQGLPAPALKRRPWAASSRLHFIGTWKARIEVLMADSTQAGPAPLATSTSRPAWRQEPQPTTPLNWRQPWARRLASVGLESGPAERAIIHVDMDCFFASAAVVGYPELQGKPLVVCHSNSSKGTAEVPYMYEKFQTISEQVYRLLLRTSSAVQPLSCDEAYLDVTGLGDPELLAAALRRDIQATTHCTASAGIGPNILVARLATRRAKPNGQYRVTSTQVLPFLADLPLSDLPGVGWAQQQKLAEKNLSTVRQAACAPRLSSEKPVSVCDCDYRPASPQVWSSSKEQLQRILGEKTGSALWAHAHGRDDRQVEPPKARKSVGAEVNWGIRFDSYEDAERFLAELAQEVATRMATAGVQGKTVTLKTWALKHIQLAASVGAVRLDSVMIKRRQQGAPTPWKALGHGPCDNLSRSVTLARFTASAGQLLEAAGGLMRAMGVAAGEMRGLGITRLFSEVCDVPDSAGDLGAFVLPKRSRAAPQQMHTATAAGAEAASHSGHHTTSSVQGLGQGAGRVAALPPASQLDLTVLAQLPEELRREIEAAYAGQLINSATVTWDVQSQTLREVLSPRPANSQGPDTLIKDGLPLSVVSTSHQRQQVISVSKDCE
ncbi:hypothetical protein V8C86DRAFT_2430773 [Haematococcus lacustris]